MSNIIPMVSSSPPPLDEVPSFTDAWDDDDDGDDFGNFTGADTLTEIPDYNQCALPSPSRDTSSISLDTDLSVDNEQTEKDICNNSPTVKVIESQKKPSSLDLPCTTSKSQCEKENGSVSPVVSENSLSKSGLIDSGQNKKKDSTTDSGMCSTEISPIPISDEITDFSDSKCTVSDTDEMFTKVETPDSMESIHETPDNDEEKINSGVFLDTNGSTENIADLPVEMEIEESTESENERLNGTGVEKAKENVNESQVSEENNGSSPAIGEKLESTDNIDGSSPAITSEESPTISHDQTNSENFEEEKCKTMECSEANPTQDGVDGDDNETETWSDFSDFAQAPETHDHVDSSEPISSSGSKDNDTDSVENIDARNETDSNVNHNDDEVDNKSTSSKVEPQENTFSNFEQKSDSTSDVPQNPVDDCGGFDAFPEAASESDNWADFASFPDNGTETESITVETEKRTENKTGPNLDDGSGEFAEFKTVDSQDDLNKFKVNNDLESDGDDFGDFRTVENIDDDFSDFTEPQETSAKESSRTSDWSKKGQQASHVRLKAPVPEKIVGVLETCFPANSTDLVSLNQLSEILDDIMEKSSQLRVPNPVRYKYKQAKNQDQSSERDVENIWQYLRDIEKSTAVKYQWAESSGNKKLFSTLKIDVRNVLNCGVKKPGIPIYAANLGLLEPTRGEQKQKEEAKKVVTSLVDTSKSDNTTTILQEEIPPAQFDWSGSGLTNPLGAQSSLLDLDLLAVNEGKSDGDGKGKVFESDALGGNEKLKLVPKTLKPLEMVLASMKFNPTIKQVKMDEKLSSEATKIINSLPDLSFMQAKVLMFPVRSLAEEGLNGNS